MYRNGSRNIYDYLDKEIDRAYVYLCPRQSRLRLV